MSRSLLISALTVVLTWGNVWGAPQTNSGSLESFLTKDQQFWVEGIVEFIEDGEEHIEPLDVEPVTAGKLKTFTQIAGSYNISAKELERAYSLAVERAAKKSLEKLKEKLEEEGNLSDADVAFLMGGIAEFLKFNYGNLVKNYSEKIAGRELREALKECTSLRLSPMIEAFIKSKDCRELLKEFPSDVERVVFSQLGRRERELLSNPSLTDKPNLRYILESLKRFDLSGG